MIHWKSDIGRDTIRELSDPKTFSSAVYFSVFGFGENLTLKEILYLNFVMVGLMHPSLFINDRVNISMRCAKCV